MVPVMIDMSVEIGLAIKIAHLTAFQNQSYALFGLIGKSNFPDQAIKLNPVLTAAEKQSLLRALVMIGFQNPSKSPRAASI